MPYKDPERNKAAKADYRERNREKLKADSKAHYANNRERWYAYELGKNYSLSLDQYKEMLQEQNNCCAICGGHNKNGTRLCVDHDHRTGRIRALLCRRCNTLLGLCDDNIEILLAMIQYLEEYND